jgi:hypothetical protein
VSLLGTGRKISRVDSSIQTSCHSEIQQLIKVGMENVDTGTIRKAMVAAARGAGDILMRYYYKDTLAVEFKNPVDLVSEADQRAEEVTNPASFAYYL